MRRAGPGRAGKDNIRLDGPDLHHRPAVANV